MFTLTLMAVANMDRGHALHELHSPRAKAGCVILSEQQELEILTVTLNGGRCTYYLPIY